MPIKTVGFIGLGVMGASMASLLLGGGYDLTVYNRTKEKAEPLLAKGAKWAETPAEVAASSEVVITIVGYPKDVEDVYLGPNGILEKKKGGYVVDMTTSSPILAKRIFKEAKAKGIAALDASASAYNAFVGAPAEWDDATAYDAQLATYYGGKYNLPTVDRLGYVGVQAAEGSEPVAAGQPAAVIPDFVATHRGDWPAPEIFVENE